MTAFSYGTTNINKIGVEIDPLNKGKKGKKKRLAKYIVIDDEKVIPTDRFWKSFQMMFKLNQNVFNYYDYVEVFERISQRAKAEVRYCIERNEGREGKVLAITNPTKAMIECGNLVEILDEHNAKSCNYTNGIVRSEHAPRVPWEFSIGGDKFVNQFVVDTPIDGFGKPAIYVSLLREVCTNGAIAFSPAFRSELTIGKKDGSIEFSLNRALESFNNEEAYSAMQGRFDSSTRSWSSVNEAMKLQKTVLKVYNNGDLIGVKKITIGGDSGNTYDDIPVMKDLMKITGDLNKHYGLSNIDALSEKKQRTLPASCKVYDLLNFASEVATHHSSPSGARQLQAYIGTLISSEYDLEGTAEHFSDWKDFFISNEKTAETMAEMT